MDTVLIKWGSQNIFFPYIIYWKNAYSYLTTFKEESTNKKKSQMLFCS